MECPSVPPTLSGTETRYLPGQVPAQPQSSSGLSVMNKVTLQGPRSVGVTDSSGAGPVFEELHWGLQILSMKQLEFLLKQFQPRGRIVTKVTRPTERRD